VSPTHADFVALIEGLRDADPTRGILLVDARFRETFHPYAALHRRAVALSRSFARQGLTPGQRVILPLATDIDAIASCRSR
jgi:acyl-CoA synthetase (AMP-forming)/AMP-acid ligase II